MERLTIKKRVGIRTQLHFYPDGPFQRLMSDVQEAYTTPSALARKLGYNGKTTGASMKRSVENYSMGLDKIMKVYDLYKEMKREPPVSVVELIGGVEFVEYPSLSKEEVLGYLREKGYV
jgi:hypothetical protein